jgi:hypothetical protein
MMKKDENLIFIMVLLFMVSMFGYNGQRSWGEKITPTSTYLKLDSGATNQKEWIDSSLLVKPGTEIVERKKKKKLKVDVVTVTRYNPVKSQCDDDPLTTADQSEINLSKLKRKKIRWVAVSQDLLSKYPFGEKIVIACNTDPSINGVYEVHDSMNKRMRGRVDILTHISEESSGLWKDVTIYKK